MNAELAKQDRYPQPRVHGNGFIQIDVTPDVRMHVWMPGVPRQRVSTQVHDHTFGFRSHILRGCIKHTQYEAVPDVNGGHEVHMATVSAGENTELSGTGMYVRLVPVRSRIYAAGESYTMRAGEIHETEPYAWAVTLILKDAPTLAQGGLPPRVFVPRGLAPDNKFNRYATPPEELWRTVREALS
jgi:hypothetical protein